MKERKNKHISLIHEDHLEVLPSFSSHSSYTRCINLDLIAVCFLWLSLPGDYRVTDEALLAETT